MPMITKTDYKETKIMVNIIMVNNYNLLQLQADFCCRSEKKNLQCFSNLRSSRVRSLTEVMRKGSVCVRGERERPTTVIKK